MRSSKLAAPESWLDSASLILRLMLRSGEIFRLPATSRGVQVVSGLAWLTMAGEDIFLKSGEKLGLLMTKELVLVSGLGCTPLILEVWGDRALSSPGMLIAPQPSRPGTI